MDGGRQRHEHIQKYAIDGGGGPDIAESMAVGGRAEADGDNHEDPEPQGCSVTLGPLLVELARTVP